MKSSGGWLQQEKLPRVEIKSSLKDPSFFDAAVEAMCNNDSVRETMLTARVLFGVVLEDTS